MSTSGVNVGGPSEITDIASGSNPDEDIGAMVFYDGQYVGNIEYGGTYVATVHPVLSR